MVEHHGRTDPGAANGSGDDFGWMPVVSPSGFRAASGSSGRTGQAVTAGGSREAAHCASGGLVGELRSWVRDRLAKQARLQDLLLANAVVAVDLSLPVVLQRIVDAARDLLEARYAALSLVGCNGQLEEFAHSGVGDALAAQIGALPLGRGLLGDVITRDKPVRLTDLAGHPAFTGFPPAHPTMRGFLAVPIRIEGRVLGSLCFAERLQGTFTAEDEQLALALAHAAGGAIRNVRKYRESEQQRAWMAASKRLERRLLEADATDPFPLIAAEAMIAADADGAMISHPHGEDRVIDVAAVGSMAAMRNRTVPRQGSMAERLVLAGQPILVTDHRDDTSGQLSGVAVGPVVVVGLVGRKRSYGALTVGRPANRPGFSDADIDQLAAFASQAALAMEFAIGLELDGARADQAAIDARQADRERIARDLHDHVIQQLLAVGAGLQGLARVTDSPAHARLVDGYAGDLEQVMSNIRTSIFRLQPDRHDPAGVHARLLDMVDQHAAQLGFTAQVRFAGPLGLGVEPAMADDILAVTREAISNCARHARASTLDIVLTLAERLITLEITDNGRGIATTDFTGGLRNMRDRARQHNGALELGTPAGGGTRLTWIANTLHPALA